MNKLCYVWRTDFILRIKEQETPLILHERDDDDDDNNNNDNNNNVFEGHYRIQ
jgi:hypothetical protein